METSGVRHPAPGALRLVQDLVNTVDLESGADGLLGGPDLLTQWARDHGVESAGEFDAAGLAQVLALREALRDACSAHAGAQMAPATLGELNALLAVGPLRLVVDAEGAARLRAAEGLTGVAALTGRVAAAVAEAVADGTWIRLKACAAETCRWLYYDRSPAGHSRWCTMATCGSRAKMRTYRRNRAG